MEIKFGITYMVTQTHIYYKLKPMLVYVLENVYTFNTIKKNRSG